MYLLTALSIALTILKNGKYQEYIRDECATAYPRVYNYAFLT